MPRSAIAQFLRNQVRLHHLAAASGSSVDEVRDTLVVGQEAGADGLLLPLGPGVSRRKFLGGAAAVAAGAAALSVGRPGWATQPRIAVVGGGLAGLTTALTLADAGYACTIYETTEGIIGGRCQSDGGSAQGYASGATCNVCHQSRTQGDDGYWDDGYVTDIYGEMIDTDHTVMIGLANRFGLELVDMLAAEPAGSTETYHFFGSYYPKVQADADFSALYRTVRQDLQSAGYPTMYNQSRPGGLLLDSMSIHDWIETRIPGGYTHPLGQLLDAAYAIEFGADCTDQSALSLLYLLGYGSRNTLQVFGPSDERFHMRGGIHRLPQAMAEHLGLDTIRFGYWLEAISENPDGTYTLDFDVASSGHQAVVADHVVLALPFAVLRELEYSEAGFDDLKDYAIQELGRGKNGKLQLQFSERYWNRPGPWGLSTGTAYADTGFQNTWEPTRGEPGSSGILLKYTGGSVVDGLRQNHPYGNTTSSRVEDDALAFLDELEPVYPGIWDYWTGKATGAMPHLDYRFNNSYSYWRVGQYQQFAGYERVRQGNVSFAGEHTSVDFQGWMEGAVRSGVDAGNEIVSSLRRRRR